MDKPEEQEYAHWNRVYLAVVIFLAAVMTWLWLFSKTFE